MFAILKETHWTSQKASAMFDVPHVSIKYIKGNDGTLETNGAQ